ncbi:MAG: hypothetical protein PWQ10_279 [Patescibacteria group bacterium]|nr:hypothetical protein [Patescibacteria group bacterium]
MTEKQPKIEYLLFFIPVFMAGAVGGFLGFVNHSNPMSGFLLGIGVGLVIFIVCGIGFFGWEWIKKEAGKGKLLPYLLIGFLVAIAISGMTAINLGKPSCDEYADAPHSDGCISYADDGFEATNSQKWNEFWSVLPIRVVVMSLIAVIVRNQIRKDQK